MNTVINTFCSKYLAWVPAVAVAMVLSTSAMTVRAADEPAAAPAADAAAPAADEEGSAE